MIDSTPVTAGTAPGADDAVDLALLRRYEPILRFTHGEMFFPMPAERYLESAALLAGPTQVDGDAYPPAWLDARVEPGTLRIIGGAAG